MIDRIVIINDLSFPMGGASQLAVESARAFRARGHQVTFLSGDAGNLELTAEGIESVGMGQDRLLSGNAVSASIRGLYNAKARAKVASWIAERDTPATVYHIHGWSQILSPSLFAALAPVMARVVMTAHDFFLTCPNGAMFDFRASQPCSLRPMSGACFKTSCDRRHHVHKLWRFARHAILNRLRGRSFPTQLLIHARMAEYFARAGVSAGDMVTLPNPVTPYRSTRIEAERNASALFVGRIEATKGIDRAAEACSKAGVKLIAIGDGTLLDSLRSEYPEHEWLGRKRPDQIGEIAQHARMLLMPSLHMEPFGLSAVEALWSGLPVLLSADSLLSDDIENAQAGVAFDMRDPTALGAAIAALAGDDALTQKMSHAAFTQTRHVALTPDAWIDALIAAYSGLLSAQKAGVAKASQGWPGYLDACASSAGIGPDTAPSNLSEFESKACASM